MLALAAAAVFAIWPVVGDAPWLDGDESPTPTPIPEARYSPEEAVGLVWAALDQNVYCENIRYSENGWAAEFEADRGSWLVAGGCSKKGGPPLDSIPEKWRNALWRVFEDDGRVIPLTDLAASLMRPPRD